MTDLKIDVAEWCEEHLKRCKVGDRNIDAECPWCERWGAFRVSRETGQYNCYKCSDQYDRGSKDRKGDEDRSVGFFPRLVAHVEGITIREACSKCFDQARAVWQKKTEREAKPERRVWNPPPEGIAIYDESRERRWMVPRYLKDRGISREALREFDVRYATDGPCAGRAIIPIRSPAGTSWTARLMSAGEPRYLNPSDSGHGRLLLGWEQLPASGPILAPVEGPFKSIAALQDGSECFAPTICIRRFRFGLRGSYTIATETIASLPCRSVYLQASKAGRTCAVCCIA